MQQLYGEAISHASTRPPIIQPTGIPTTAAPTPAGGGVRYHIENLPEQDQRVQSASGTTSKVRPTVEPARPLRGIPMSNAVTPAVWNATPEDGSGVVPLPVLTAPLPLPGATWDAPVQLASFRQESSVPLVTDDRDDEDVREVIRSLADQAQVSVVVDELVNGNATIHCVNEPFDKALEKVLLPLGYYFTRNGDEYIVAPAEPKAQLFHYIATRTQYTPRFHDISTLQPLLPLRFKDFLHVSTERNMVNIEAPPAIAEEIVRCLEELDTPVPQVELEAIVCVTTPDSTFRFGLDWGHVVKVNNAEAFKVGMTGLAFEGTSSGTGVDNAFSNFAVTSAFVRLLAQEGYITIRAAPRVTARDGEKASISINRETFFSLQPSNSNLLFRQDVQKVEAGIMLDIVPRVHDDIVSVKIVRAEVSEDIRSSDPNATLTSNPYPIINRRQVSTEVNVRDGHTIVIGGLVQRQTVDRVNRIPGLSNLPVVGKMFQTIDKQEAEAEVAIFISPRIVHGDACSVE